MFAGLAYLIVLLIIRLFIRFSGLAAIIDNDDNLIGVFYYSQVTLAVLLQVGSAVLVAFMVRELRSLYGLMAAFICGCISAFGLLALNLLFGGTFGLEITWLTVALVVNGGALLALLVAMSISMLIEWMNRTKSHPTVQSA